MAQPKLTPRLTVHLYRYTPLRTALLLLLLAGLTAPPQVRAQETPPQRQIRTYIPPDQLVSFRPSTPFNEFVNHLAPIFERVTGKQVIDPESRTREIGISVAGMHFLDAFELVLDVNGLTHRETEDYFIVQEAPTPNGQRAGGSADSTRQGPIQKPVATLGTREIEIDALLFEINRTKARQLGLDWNVFFGDQSSSQQSGGGGGSGSAQGEQARFYLKTEELFDPVSDYIAAPDQIEMSQLTQFIRLLENENAGRTIANPSVKVQSSEEGRIQIGSDIPVQTRDFAGNTVTQFVSTGIIIDVVPTLIEEPVADSAGAPTVEFIHLDVEVERSSGRPFGANSVAIDRSTANTQALFLDGEQTIIGGLYSTDKTTVRRGIPLLKDLPPWVFGLRYIFGFNQTTKTRRELLIALEVNIVEPLMERAESELPDQLRGNKQQQMRDVLERFDERSAQGFRVPEPVNPFGNDDDEE